MSTSNNNSTVQFSVDASGAEAGVNKLRAASANANAAMDSMAQRAALVDSAMREAAANGFDLNARAANKLAAEYQRLADTAGKTQAQILAQKAANTGVTGTFASMQTQIAAASAETHGFSLSTSAAKRELLVLAHELSQGNYKKFGGSMLVLGEQTGAAGLLFSAAGLGALGLGAGIAAAAYQVIKGIESFNELKASVQATNDYVGLTTSQLQDMATKLAGTSSTIDATTSVIAQLVASGRVAGDTLSLAAQAAVDFGKQTGMASDEAVKAMVKFAEDPAKAIVDLQGKYHEFSGAQVDVIEGFIKQGNTQAAVAAGYQAIIDNSAAMTPKVLADEGLIEGSYDGWIIKLKSVASYLQSVGRTATSQQLIADATTNAAEAQTRYNAALAKNPNGFDTASAKKALDYANDQLIAQRKVQEGAQNAADADKARAKQGDATLATHQFIDNTKYANPADRYQLELDANAKNFANATKDLDKNGSLYAEALKRNSDNIAQIKEEYAKKTKGKAPSENGIQTMLAALASSQADRVAIEKNAETQLKAQRDAGLIDTETYFKSLHDTQYQALTDEIAIAQQRADVAGQKREKQAQATALGDVKKLSDARAALEQNLNDSLRTFYAQRGTDVQKYADTESAALRNQMAVREQSYATMFLSPDAKANSDASFALQQQYYKKLDALQKQYDSPTADQDRYAAERGIAKTYYAAQVADLQASQATQLAIRSSYSDQVRLAMVQMAGTTKTNAELAAEAFSTSFNDMQNALETFVTTGKFSFSSFASSVTADLAKIALKAAESQIFNAVLSSSSFFSDGGSVGHFASGGNISGPGSGTSDSIPAMLSNGEFIVRASQAKKYGSLLESINSGRMSHYASGGAVGSVPAGGGASVSNQHSNTFNLQSSGMTQEDVAALAPQIQNLIDRRMAQKIRGQGGYGDMIRQNRI